MTALYENTEVAKRRLEALRAYSRRQERSLQTRVGMSEIGGADCALQHRLLGTPTTNHSTQVMAALRGTAFHKMLEEALPAYETPDIELSTELAVSLEDLLGHVDLAWTAEGVVEDSKTKDKNGMANARQYGPGRDYIWQNHLYAAALISVDIPIHTLRWTYYSVSSPDDIYVVDMPYDPAITAEAIAHYSRIKQAADNGEVPEPLRDPASWCQPYCQFYDPTAEVGCPGRTLKAVEYSADPFDDGNLPELEAAATQYKEGAALEVRGKQLKDLAREQLLGVRGVAGAWVISWSNPSPKDVVDKDAAVQRLVQLGEPVPTVTKCSSPAISVKPVNP